MKQFIMSKKLHSTARADKNIKDTAKMLKIFSPRVEIHIRRGGKFMTWHAYNTTDTWITMLVFYASEHKGDKKYISTIWPLIVELMKHNKQRVPYVLDMAGDGEMATNIWGAPVIFPLLDKITAGEAAPDTVVVKRLAPAKRKGGNQ